jgi:hypothetical protein
MNAVNFSVTTLWSPLLDNASRPIRFRPDNGVTKSP